MRTVQVSEFKERLDEVVEAVRNGEIVEIWERDVCIAEVRPKLRAVDGSAEHPDETALQAHLDDLVRQGKARRDTGDFPADFFTRPLPKAKKSVLEQLLEDRRSGR
jgi:antitoxin (DNA-binding transcriptional repressor) of toxin-antitoxin stability system